MTGPVSIDARVRPVLQAVGKAALAVLVSALVTFKLIAQIAVGADWDTFSFVANAAEWAGRGYGYTELSRPPLISLIAAVPMRLGFEGPAVIQAVDALLAVGSLAVFYLLFRRRFSVALSSAGVVALLVSPPLWRWVGVGYTDLASMGLCALALLLVLKAAEDPRWYIAAFPTFLAAGLMRHTALLFGFSLAVAVLLLVRPFRHAKVIMLGLAATAAALLPFAIYYQRLVGHALYPFVVSMAIKQGMGSSGDAHMEIEGYLSGLPSLAGPAVLKPLTIVILAGALLGLLVAAPGSIRGRRVSVARVLAALVVVAASVTVVGGASVGVSSATIAAATFIVWRLVASDPTRVVGGTSRSVTAEHALDAAMLVWMLSYWQFHEGWAQHFVRYYITMAPGVVYFGLLGLRASVALLGARADREGASFSLRAASRLVAPALTIALVAGLSVNVATTSRTPNKDVAEAKSAAAWLAVQPDIDEVAVYSDLWPLTAYYMQRSVEPMPFFDSKEAVQHELDVAEVRYYVTLKGYRPRGYAVARTEGDSAILARQSAAAEADQLPKLLYLGAGWENYLEDVAGYALNLVHNEGDYNMEGSAYYDAYSAEELARYDAVAAFGGRWRSRPGFERTLEQYVRGGGTLLMDVSANMTRPHDLNRSALLGTVIDRQPVRSEAAVSVSGNFAARHPEVASVETSPWVAEDGSAWYGASYSPLPATRDFRVLATLDGRPLVAEQHLGRGRILWVGANLLWHAHTSGSESEARLVQAVLDEALSPQAGALASADADAAVR